MEGISGYQWVSIEVVKMENLATFNGRIASSDLVAVTNGTYSHPFIRLVDVHWIESVWNEADRTHATRVTTFGEPGQYEFHTGEFFLRPDQIINIAILNGTAVKNQSR